MSMNTGVSGLQAANEDLATISNNIANANTVGYKSMDAQFADVYSSTSSSGGVYVSDVETDFSQGTLVYTTSTTDLAIDGDGYFILQDANGQQYYTRNGNFSTDKDGYLVNDQGQQLMGYAVDENGNVIEGQLVPLPINQSDMGAVASTEASIDANLDSRSEAIDRKDVPFDSSDPDSYHTTTTSTVYDSQGNEHQVTAYYTKTGENTWEVQYELDGEPVKGGVGGQDFVVSLTYDENGDLISSSDNSVQGGNDHANPGEFTIPLDLDNGASDIELLMDISGVSQYGNDFSVSATSNDGHPAGTFLGVTISEEGAIIATYSNGQSEVQGYVALATFPNDDGLEAAGNTSWQETPESGEPIVGLPGSGTSGDLVGGALENSNVDMSMELVDMIVAQSAYQANTKTISVFDENTQTLLNTF